MRKLHDVCFLILLHCCTVALCVTLETFPLEGMHFPTFDPFLFCAYHKDEYPPADATSTGVPTKLLEGRNLGNDFSQRDGWSMYHGTTVPGFPAHPHRGFETVTVTLRGIVDHADSEGHAVRYGGGDVQWMTAGRGLQHSEMFPLLNTKEANELELFQIWLNLPKRRKMVLPEYVVFPSSKVPKIDVGDSCGTVTVVAGPFYNSRTSQAPPKHSWAFDETNDVAVWLLETSGPCEITLPPCRFPGVHRTLYLYNNTGVVRVGGARVVGRSGVRLDPSEQVVLTTALATKALVLQGRPIREPVIQSGPMVMNTREEVRAAFAEFEQTQFGGWPWDRRDVTLSAAAVGSDDL